MPTKAELERIIANLSHQLGLAQAEGGAAQTAGGGLAEALTSLEERFNLTNTERVQLRALVESPAADLQAKGTQIRDFLDRLGIKASQLTRVERQALIEQAPGLQQTPERAQAERLREAEVKGALGEEDFARKIESLEKNIPETQLIARDVAVKRINDGIARGVVLEQGEFNTLLAQATGDPTKPMLSAEEVAKLESARSQLVESHRNELVAKVQQQAGVKDLSPETVRAISELEPSTLKAQEPGKFVEIDRAIRKAQSSVLGGLARTFTASGAKEKAIGEILGGDITKGQRTARLGKIKGGGLAGLIGIPLLMTLLGRNQDQPEETNLMNLFLQQQAQESAGQQALLNSKLQLNQARAGKLAGQAEADQIKNLLLMTQLTGGAGGGLG